MVISASSLARTNVEKHRNLCCSNAKRKGRLCRKFCSTQSKGAGS